MRLAPDEVLVAARVDLDDTATGGDLELHADEVDRRVRERFPEVQHIFLDPTDATPSTPDPSAPAEPPQLRWCGWTSDLWPESDPTGAPDPSDCCVDRHRGAGAR